MDAFHLRYYLDMLITTLLHASPWLIGTALVVFSPLGRSVAAALRERRQGTDLLQESNEHMRELKQSLSEVVEQLDATDRQLRQVALPKAERPEPRIATPV